MSNGHGLGHELEITYQIMIRERGHNLIKHFVHSSLVAAIILQSILHLLGFVIIVLLHF